MSIILSTRRPHGGVALSCCLWLAAVGSWLVASDAPATNAALAAPVPSTPDSTTAPWSGPVPVSRLIAVARSTHPTAAAVAAARATAVAQMRQAGTWDNPELELSVGRNRPHRAEVERDRPYGGSLSQRLEWWGTRSARVEAARAGLTATEADGRAAMLALEADVRLAAIAYAAACDAAMDAVREADLSAELARISAQQVAAGDRDRASAARIRLDMTTTALRRDARQRDIATALAVLRTWCDPALPDGVVISDAWHLPTTAWDAERLQTMIDAHPRLRALAATVDAAQARIIAAERARLPDVTVGVFADREYDQDTYGVTLGFALPLWDRHQHAITAAEAERAQARAAVHNERLRLQRDLAEAIGIVTTARAEADALAQHALPAAAEAVELRTAAYRAGDAGLADLLEARRAALAAQSEWRDARRRGAEALVRLRQVIGDAQLD